MRRLSTVIDDYVVRVVCLVCALCGVLALSACSKGSSTPTPQTQGTTTTTLPQADPPSLTSAGEAPLQRLSPAMTKGDTALIQIVTDLEVNQDSDSQLQRLDSPLVVQYIRLTVISASHSGYQLQAKIENVEVNGDETDLTEDQLSTITKEIGALKGLTTTTDFDKLGRPTKFDFKSPPAMSENAKSLIGGLRAQMEMIAPSLPVEPVGVGARWEHPVSSVDSSTGVEVSGTRTTTITAIEGTKISYEMDLELKATSGSGGTSGEMRVESGETTGSVTGWFDLSSPSYQLESNTMSSLTYEIDGLRVVQDSRTTTRAKPLSE